MIKRIITIAVLLAGLFLLATCRGAPPTNTSTQLPTSTGAIPTPSTYAGYLAKDIPPCTPIAGSSVDPCEPGALPVEGGIGQYLPDLGDEPFSIREMLDEPHPPAWVPHLVVRGTYIPGTVRCTAGDSFRPPSYLIDEFGDTSDERSFKCYVDMRANAYIVGSGPSILTILLFRLNYWDDLYVSVATEGQAGHDGIEIEKDRQRWEALLGELFPGREHVMFLGPSVDLSSETWRFMGYWDVQRAENGTVFAIHPERDLWRRLKPDDYATYRWSILEMELPAFTLAVTTANQARVSEYGGRIGADKSLPMLLTDVNDLHQYYVNTGAYDHPDGTPVPPPPVPGEGDPVTNIGVDDSTPGASPVPPGGVEDSPAAPPAPQAVTASLADGTFTISWDAVEGAARYKAQSRKSGSDEEWADVETTETTSSTFIPAGGPDCGSTYEFRALAYGDGATYAADWSEPSDPASVPTGACNRSPEFGAASYSFSIAEDAATGSSVGSVIATDPDEGDTVSYSITAGDEDGHFAIDAGTGAITVAGALDYETASLYTLTVQAGDGNDGSATAAVIITVTEVGEENTTPFFEVSSYYSFSVPEDAASGATVGAVSATELDEGDTVSYSITAGNEDGHFTIDAGTGAITVAGALDYETASSYTLTVVASDGTGGSATAWVTVTVTDVDENSAP